MKLNILSLVVALGAVLFTLFRPVGDGAPTRTVDAATPVVDEDLGGELRALRKSTEALADRLEQIEMRQSLLESRPAASQRQVAIETVDEPQASEQVEQQLRELAAALENPGMVPNLEFESLVLSVLDSRERDEEAEREERRRIAREEEVSRRVAELTEELGLNLSQAKGVHGVLTTSQARRDELFRSMREDGVFDRTTMRETMGTIRDESRTELQGILAQDQYDRYIELEDSDRRGFGRGPGGDFGGGGGRRGGEDGGGGRDRRR